MASIFSQLQQAADYVASQQVSSGGGSSRGSSSGSRPSGGGSVTSAPKPNVDRNTLAQQYGFTLAFFNAYPEVGTLFDQAVREGWTADRFQAAFKNTNWYKSTSDQSRKMALLSTSDPGEWGALWNRTQNHVLAIMGDMGVQTDWDNVNAVSARIIWDGWNDERTRQELGSYITFGGPSGYASGKAGEYQQELNTYAYSMGVKNADPWIQSAVRDITTGHGSMQQYKNSIRDQAVAMFPGLGDQLKAGMTVQDLAQPYTQSMSQILEIAPGQVNVFDPTIQKALGWKDSSGQAAMKPLWQFQNDLRSDDRWKKTQNAQDASMGVAHKVLQEMGFYS